MSEVAEGIIERVQAHTAQVTTDAYAGVPESHLKALGKNRIDYHIVNEDAANSITAKAVGRYVQADGAAGAWIDASAEATIAGGGTNYANIQIEDLEFDEYAVQVKATSGGSQGDARVYGNARLVPDRARGREGDLGATVAVGSESSDDIDLTIQLSRAEQRPVHVELLEGDQDASGVLTEAATAAFTLTDGGAGTVLAGASTREAVFMPDASGTIVATVTDVNGASGLAVIAVVRDGSKDGRILALACAQFD